MNNNLRPQKPLPPLPRDEGPPNVDVPLEHQTKESLIALVESMDKQAKDNEKRTAAEREWIRIVRGQLPDYGTFSGVQNSHDEVSMTWHWTSWKQIQKATANLNALTPAPEEKE